MKRCNGKPCKKLGGLNFARHEQFSKKYLKYVKPRCGV